MTVITSETWNVRVNHRQVATVELSGSRTDWQMVSRYRQMIADASDGDRVTLSSAANDAGCLMTCPRSL